LNKFACEAPRDFGKDASAAAAAVPQGISLVTFQLADRKMKAVIPPTYIYRTARALYVDGVGSFARLEAFFVGDRIDRDDLQAAVWKDAAALPPCAGCVRCQTVCPENRECMRKKAVVADFDEAETSMILANEPAGTQGFSDKLKRLDMDEYADVLCRSLKLLISAKAA
jgi:ferredoxin